MSEWPINTNNKEKPEKESAEVLAYKKEVEERIRNLLETNSDLRDVAKFLGAEKYIRIFPGKRQTVIFKAKDFISDQIKSQTFLKLPTKFLKTDDVILPPDPGEIITGSGEGMNPKEYIPRSQYLIELLTEMDLDYESTEGENTPNMMRKLSYYGVVIKEINKLVLVNNEEGNATFIIHNFEGDFSEAKTYIDMKKSEIKELDNFSYIEYHGDKEKWKLAIRDLLENGAKEKKEKVENINDKIDNKETQKLTLEIIENDPNIAKQLAEILENENVKSEKSINIPPYHEGRINSFLVRMANSERLDATPGQVMSYFLNLTKLGKEKAIEILEKEKKTQGLTIEAIEDNSDITK